RVVGDATAVAAERLVPHTVAGAYRGAIVLEAGHHDARVGRVVGDEPGLQHRQTVVASGEGARIAVGVGPEHAAVGAGPHRVLTCRPGGQPHPQDVDVGVGTFPDHGRGDGGRRRLAAVDGAVVPGGRARRRTA